MPPQTNYITENKNKNETLFYKTINSYKMYISYEEFNSITEEGTSFKAC